MFNAIEAREKQRAAILDIEKTEKTEEIKEIMEWIENGVEWAIKNAKTNIDICLKPSDPYGTLEGILIEKGYAVKIDEGYIRCGLFRKEFYRTMNVKWNY